MYIILFHLEESGDEEAHDQFLRRYHPWWLPVNHDYSFLSC